jgi:hypothetical protein
VLLPFQAVMLISLLTPNCLAISSSASLCCYSASCCQLWKFPFIFSATVQLQWGLRLWSWVLEQRITTWTWGCAGQQWRSLFSEECI